MKRNFCFLWKKQLGFTESLYFCFSVFISLISSLIFKYFSWFCMFLFIKPLGYIIYRNFKIFLLDLFFDPFIIQNYYLNQTCYFLFMICVISGDFFLLTISSLVLWSHRIYGCGSFCVCLLILFCCCCCCLINSIQSTGNLIWEIPYIRLAYGIVCGGFSWLMSDVVGVHPLLSK